MILVRFLFLSIEFRVPALGGGVRKASEGMSVVLRGSNGGCISLFEGPGSMTTIVSEGSYELVSRCQ